MDVLLAKHFSNLSTRGRILVEYVFITNGAELRSATKILDRRPVAVADVPIWSQSLDGSMFYLKPRSMHPDPLRCDLPRLHVLLSVARPMREGGHIQWPFGS